MRQVRTARLHHNRYKNQSLQQGAGHLAPVTTQGYYKCHATITAGHMHCQWCKFMILLCFATARHLPSIT
jgi:hypothetical protein